MPSTVPIPVPTLPALVPSAAATPTPSDQVTGASEDHPATKFNASPVSRPNYSYENVPPRDVLLVQLSILRERSLELADAGCWLKRHYIMRNGFDHVDGKDWDGHDGLDAFLANVDQVLAPRFDISPAEYTMLTGWIPSRPEAGGEPTASSRKKLARRREDITVTDAAPKELAPIIESDAPSAKPVVAVTDTTASASTPPTMMSHGFRPISAIPITHMPLLAADTSPESAPIVAEDEANSESDSESDGSSLHTPTSSSLSCPTTALPYPGLANGPSLRPKKAKKPHLAEGLNLLPEHLDHFRRGAIMKFIKGGQHPRVIEHDARARESREEHQRWFEERWKVRRAEKPKFCSDEERCVCGWGERIKGPRPIETKPLFGPRNMLPTYISPPSEVSLSVSRSASASSRQSEVPSVHSQMTSDWAFIRGVAPSTRSRTSSIDKSHQVFKPLRPPSPPLTPPKLPSICLVDDSAALPCNVPLPPLVRTFTSPPTPPKTPSVRSVNSVDRTTESLFYASAHSPNPAHSASSKVSHLRAKWEVPSMVDSLSHRRGIPRPSLLEDAESISSNSSGSMYSGTQISTCL